MKFGYISLVAQCCKLTQELWKNSVLYGFVFKNLCKTYREIRTSKLNLAFCIYCRSTPSSLFSIVCPLFASKLAVLNSLQIGGAVENVTLFLR